MAADVGKNASNFVETLLPDIDGDKLLTFLQAYYEWMESSKVYHENSSGSFTKGHTISGESSYSEGVIKYVGDSYIVVKFNTIQGFYDEEVITSSGGITAEVLKVEDNPIRSANSLVENRTFEKSSGKYFTYLKNELNRTLPAAISADRKLFSERIKQLYTGKSTEEAYTYFFRTLFDSEVAFRYPGDEILRVSDGRFESKKSIRMQTYYNGSPVDSDKFVNKTIQGSDSGAIGNVVSIIRTGRSGIDYFDAELKLVSGEFIAGEEVFIITDPEIKALIYGVISGIDIVDGGTGYSVGNEILFSSGLVSSDDIEFVSGTEINSTTSDLSIYQDGDVITISGTAVSSNAAAVDNGTISNVLVVTDTTGMKVGSLISDGGTFISQGTRIQSVDSGTDLTLDTNHSAFTIDKTVTSKNNDVEYTVNGDATSTSLTVQGLAGGDDQDFFVYPAGDSYSIQRDDFGIGALGTVSSIDSGPISEVTLSAPGYGYQLGTRATVNNTGTGGSGLEIEVSKIKDTYEITNGPDTYTVGEIEEITIRNRGSGYFQPPSVDLEDGTISAIGALTDKLTTISNAGTGYSLSDSLGVVGGSGTGAIMIVAGIDGDFITLTEEGENIVFDGIDGNIILADSTDTGPISKIEFTNFGTLYTNSNLPTVDATGSGGGNAIITIDGIQGSSAELSIGSAQTGASLGGIRKIDLIDYGVNYKDAKVTANGGNGDAILTANIGGLGTSSGRFITNDGILNERVIQDSYFYQDFSYVLRTGVSFDEYSDVLKQSLHPAGTEFFGEILLTAFVSLTPQFYTFISTESYAKTIIYIEEIFSYLPDFNPSSISLLKQLGLYTGQLEVNAFKEFNVEISPEITISLNVFRANGQNVLIKLYENLYPAGYSTSSETKLEIIKEAGIAVDNPTAANDITFGNFQIEAFQNTPVSTFGNNAFEDIYGLKTLTKQLPVTGTVSITGTTVTGTATTFTSDFTLGSAFIVGNEQFIVSSITNDLELIINVVPSGSYTTETAYREYLL